MEFYTCKYCFSEFKPTRRRVQKYCSGTCRSKAHHARKTNEINSPTQKIIAPPLSLSLDTTPTKTKVEAMSASGVGNAAAGSLLAEGIKNVFTADKNKPATKGDIADLKSHLSKRYLPIKNMPFDQFGRLPYYDVSTESVIYL
ncbi:hypothetical protein [Lacinutrix chionoecetis]